MAAGEQEEPTEVDPNEKFAELMALYPQVLHSIIRTMVKDMLAEMFPRTTDPHARADLVYEPEPGDGFPPMQGKVLKNMAQKVNWLLKHAYTDCEHPDLEYRKQ